MTKGEFEKIQNLIDKRRILMRDLGECKEIVRAGFCGVITFESPFILSREIKIPCDVIKPYIKESITRYEQQIAEIDKQIEEL